VVIDILIIAILGLGTFVGISQGFKTPVKLFIVYISSFTFAVVLAKLLGFLAMRYIPAFENMNQKVYAVIILIMILLFALALRFLIKLVHFIIKLFDFRVKEEKKYRTILSRIAGGVTGFAMALFTVCVALSVIETVSVLFGGVGEWLYSYSHIAGWIGNMFEWLGIRNFEWVNKTIK